GRKGGGGGGWGGWEKGGGGGGGGGAPKRTTSGGSRRSARQITTGASRRVRSPLLRNRGAGPQADFVAELLVLRLERINRRLQLLLYLLGLVDVACHLVDQPEQGRVVGGLLLECRDEPQVLVEELGKRLLFLLGIRGEPGPEGLELGHHLAIVRLDQAAQRGLVQPWPKRVNDAVERAS